MRKPHKLTKKALVLLSVIILLMIFSLVIGIWAKVNPKQPHLNQGNIVSGSFDKSKFKSDTEWKKVLSPQQYHIVREKGTEIPFTGELLKEKRNGMYYSIGCDQPVFRSDEKYDSGTGWPSFTAPVTPDVVVLKKDMSLGYERIEVLDQCGGHLGHVFDDGPQPTGKRYCINSLALRFVPDP